MNNSVLSPRLYLAVRHVSLTQATLMKRPLTYAYLMQNNFRSIVGARRSSSSIFISDRESNISANFQFDENLRQRLTNVPKLKKDLQNRGVEIDVDKLASMYEEYQQMNARRMELEKRRAYVSKTIAQVVKIEQEQIVSKESKVMIQELRAEGKQLKTELKALLPQFWSLEEEVMLKALSLPNETSPEVTEEEQVVEEHFQDQKQSLTGGHLDALREHGGVKLSNVGNKAYYLRGRLAVLEQELIRMFSDHLRRHGYVQMCTPEMFKTSVVEAAGLPVNDTESVYRLQGKPVETSGQGDWDQDLFFLRGASSLSFTAYLARMEVSRNDLPLKMFSVGRNYIPENQITRDLPGLLGALQTVKVSACGVSESPQICQQILTELQPLVTQIYSTFKLPFRLVQCPYSRLEPPEKQRFEIQMWVPSLQSHLKVASISLYGDYSSRRLMIRTADDSPSNSSTPLYFVHCSLADITRLLAILVESGQTERTFSSLDI